MHGLRRQGRSYALQLLYQIDVSKSAEDSVQSRFWDYSHASKKAQAFAGELVQAAVAHQARIDELLTASLERWKLSRLPVIVRNVLRLAVCELVVLGREPPAVVINEALELTRTYMDEDSARFVNSVLDKVRLANAPLPAAQAQADAEPEQDEESGGDLSAWPDEDDDEDGGPGDSGASTG